MTRYTTITFPAVCRTRKKDGSIGKKTQRVEVMAEVLHDLHPESAEFATFCLHKKIDWDGVSDRAWAVSNMETGATVCDFAFSREDAIGTARMRIQNHGTNVLRQALERMGDPDK